MGTRDLEAQAYTFSEKRVKTQRSQKVNANGDEKPPYCCESLALVSTAPVPRLWKCVHRQRALPNKRSLLFV
jgi:hypothetical protein